MPKCRVIPHSAYHAQKIRMLFFYELSWSQRIIPIQTRPVTYNHHTIYQKTFRRPMCAAPCAAWSAWTVEDIELVLLPINLLQTEWDCVHPVNDPGIGRVTRSDRVDFHKLIRHVLCTFSFYWTGKNRPHWICRKYEHWRNESTWQSDTFRVRNICQIFEKQFQIQQPNLSWLLCPR